MERDGAYESCSCLRRWKIRLKIVSVNHCTKSNVSPPLNRAGPWVYKAPIIGASCWDSPRVFTLLNDQSYVNLATTQTWSLLVVRYNPVRIYVPKRSHSHPVRSPHTYTQGSDNHPKDMTYLIRASTLDLWTEGMVDVRVTSMLRFHFSIRHGITDSNRVCSGVKYTGSSLRQF